MKNITVSLRMVASGLATASAFALFSPHTAWARPPRQEAPLGAPLPDLTDEERALFVRGQALFQHEFSPKEGLGPLFNASSCVTCHSSPAVGGSAPNTANNVTHFGIVDKGRFFPNFEHGGPMAHTRSIAGDPQSPMCSIQPVAPPTSMKGTITSSRHTLLDAIPDAEILRHAGPNERKALGVVGAANWGVEMEGLGRLLQFSFDTTRTQVIGAPRVGRFGWKSQTATLFQFSAEPFNTELGVTNTFFPRELTPDGHKLNKANATDKACMVADSQPNDATEQQTLLLYYFQAFTAPPARGEQNHQTREGARVFAQIGCADCHRKSMRTVEDYYAPWPDGTAHRVAALSGKEIEPYSDLLLHDMGPLLDDQRVMGRASGRLWRTTPLWGLRHKARMLHDGSVSTLDDAIAAHGGEGTASRDRYFALDREDAAEVDAFLGSL